MKNVDNSSPLSRQQAQDLVDAISAKENLVLSATAFEADSGEWLFEATCNGTPDLETFNEIARAALSGNVGFTAEKIDPEIDWVTRALATLSPVVAGGFFIHAEHNAASIPTGLVPLHIEAATAFGTGHHETTLLCLEAIEELLKDKKPKRVLDVGTGTGILAIALAKRLKKLKQKIIASDVDRIAVKIARQNVSLNQVKNRVKTVRAKGVKTKKIRKRGPYDLIVANILLRPLLDMAPAMARIAKNKSALILSGLLDSQAASIIDAYDEHGFVFKRRFIRNEWVALVFKKT